MNPPPPPRKPRTPTLQLHPVHEPEERLRSIRPAPQTAAEALKLYREQRRRQRLQQAHSDLSAHLQALANEAADAAPHHEASEHVLAHADTREALLTPEQQDALRQDFTLDAVTQVRAEQLKQRVSSVVQSDRVQRANSVRASRVHDSELRAQRSVMTAQSEFGSRRDVTGSVVAPKNTTPHHHNREVEGAEHRALRVIAVACIVICVMQAMVFAYVVSRMTR
jgi:hypothetical protein